MRLLCLRKAFGTFVCLVLLGDRHCCFCCCLRIETESKLGKNVKFTLVESTLKCRLEFQLAGKVRK